MSLLYSFLGYELFLIIEMDIRGGRGILGFRGIIKGGIGGGGGIRGGIGIEEGVLLHVTYLFYPIPRVCLNTKL